MRFHSADAMFPIYLRFAFGSVNSTRVPPDGDCSIQIVPL
jgi:hypothetical protein